MDEQKKITDMLQTLVKPKKDKFASLLVKCVLHDNSPSVSFQAVFGPQSPTSKLKLAIQLQMYLKFPNLRDFEIASIFTEDTFKVVEMDFVNFNQIFDVDVQLHLNAFLEPRKRNQNFVKMPQVEPKLQKFDKVTSTDPKITKSAVNRQINGKEENTQKAAEKKIEKLPQKEEQKMKEIISVLNRENLSVLPTAKICKKLKLSDIIKELGGHRTVKKAVSKIFAETPKNGEKTKEKLAEKRLDSVSREKTKKSGKKRSKKEKNGVEKISKKTKNGGKKRKKASTEEEKKEEKIEKMKSDSEVACEEVNIDTMSQTLKKRQKKSAENFEKRLHLSQKLEDSKPLAQRSKIMTQATESSENYDSSSDSFSEMKKGRKQKSKKTSKKKLSSDGDSESEDILPDKKCVDK